MNFTNGISPEMQYFENDSQPLPKLEPGVDTHEARLEAAHINREVSSLLTQVPEKASEQINPYTGLANIEANAINSLAGDPQTKELLEAENLAAIAVENILGAHHPENPKIGQNETFELFGRIATGFGFSRYSNPKLSNDEALNEVLISISNDPRYAELNSGELKSHAIQWFSANSLIIGNYNKNEEEKLKERARKVKELEQYNHNSLDQLK